MRRIERGYFLRSFWRSQLVSPTSLMLRAANVDYCSLYSPGTSSSGTSWVTISPSSASGTSSTPLTTSASKALPSSRSSSTLSESAPARLLRPWRSPDWPPERAPSPAGWKSTDSVICCLARVLTGFLFFAGAFAVNDFAGGFATGLAVGLAACLAITRFFGAPDFPSAAFFTALFFVADFLGDFFTAFASVFFAALLVFFLVAMQKV
jgi:hypothetical protein